MKMLEGMKGRVILRNSGGREGGKEEEEELSLEEIRETLKKIKVGKASERDEIPEETWKYEERRWKNGHRVFVVKYGRRRNDRRDGKKG